MKGLSWRRPLLLVLILITPGVAQQQSGQPDAQRKVAPPTPVCDAAAAKLREAGASELVLVMEVNESGKVVSFQTKSPKRLELEKMKDATAAIKAMHFEPAKLHGQPVRVIVEVAFNCSLPPSTETQKRR